MAWNAGLPERKHDFPCVPQNGGWCIGFFMKAHSRRKPVGSWPAGRQDNADCGPSRGDMAGQVCPAHRTGHADIREKQSNVRVRFEESEGLVSISRFEHPVSGIHEHVGRPHSLEDIVLDDKNHRVGGGLGHPRQPTPATLVPYPSAGILTMRQGAHRARSGIAVSFELARRASGSPKGISSPAACAMATDVQFYTD
jgi:hypothetical protein